MDPIYHHWLGITPKYYVTKLTEIELTLKGSHFALLEILRKHRVYKLLWLVNDKASAMWLRVQSEKRRNSMSPRIHRSTIVSLVKTNVPATKWRDQDHPVQSDRAWHEVSWERLLRLLLVGVFRFVAKRRDQARDHDNCAEQNADHSFWQSFLAFEACACVYAC